MGQLKPLYVVFATKKILYVDMLLTSVK